MLSRFVTMAEVTVSKIFPAGAGWQAASIVADGMGHAADSATFAAITGVGDGVAVTLGHTGYFALKKAATGDASIKLGEQAGLGVWLGAAATCSGGAWQPIVNALQASEKLPFEAVAASTALLCGGAFFTGLRVGRAVMPWMPGNDNGNFSTDAYLSMAIGGASSFFVGTDVAYLGGEGNFLRPVVGVEDFDSDGLGIVKAGASTALGFCAFQSVQNVTYKQGTAWLDPTETPTETPTTATPTETPTETPTTATPTEVPTETPTTAIPT